MDLNLIQTFLVVAEFQSYTKAAEQLGLTQTCCERCNKAFRTSGR